MTAPTPAELRLIEIIKCDRPCDNGKRGAETCHVCSGTGSLVRIPNGRAFPNTDEGHASALVIVREEREKWGANDLARHPDTEEQSARDARIRAEEREVCATVAEHSQERWKRACNSATHRSDIAMALGMAKTASGIATAIRNLSSQPEGE